MDRIGPHEIEKLFRVLNTLNICPDIIKHLCKVKDLTELSKVQYDYLIYIICSKWGVIKWLEE